MKICLWCEPNSDTLSSLTMNISVLGHHSNKLQNWGGKRASRLATNYANIYNPNPKTRMSCNSKHQFSQLTRDCNHWSKFNHQRPQETPPSMTCPHSHRPSAANHSVTSPDAASPSWQCKTSCWKYRQSPHTKIDSNLWKHLISDLKCLNKFRIKDWSSATIQSLKTEKKLALVQKRI